MRDVSLGETAGAGVLPGVWARITSSPRRLLMLDYDGTLAAFHVERDRAIPSRRVHDALGAVVGAETVAVISGRPLPQLRELLAGIPVHLVGEHGWEQQAPGEPPVVHAVPESVAKRLEAALRAAQACGWRDHLESKRASIVLHTRGLPRDRAEAIERQCQELWSRFFERGGLQLDPIDGGLELLATHRGKGVVAWEYLQREPAGTLPVYLGDDESDEQAFRVIRPYGVTVRIGRPHMPSAAEWRLGSTDDVAAFLERWHTVVPRRAT
jgi:trehalose 6-phosphate phosphatase